jgi:XTP/dITP diphosphohydrolase
MTPSKDLVIASTNLGKLSEFREIFAPLGWNILPLSNFTDEPIIEDGLTFSENALIKARKGAKLSGLPTLGDDSGLQVLGLGNFPGIIAARFANACGGYDKAMEKIMIMLENGVPTAQFKCSLTLALPHLGEQLFEGEISGNLIAQPLGDKGFGYDPYFVPHGYTQSFAQMSPDKKNAISHRGQAVQKLINYFSKLA